MQEVFIHSLSQPVIRFFLMTYQKSAFEQGGLAAFGGSDEERKFSQAKIP
jgi:hypothetical protein